MGQLKWILAAADFRRWLFRIGDGCWAFARRRGSSRFGVSTVDSPIPFYSTAKVGSMFPDPQPGSDFADQFTVTEDSYHRDL
jgi:hypothetical protein